MLQLRNRRILIVVLLAILFGGASLTNLGTLEDPLDPSISILRFLMIGTSLIGLLTLSGYNKWNIPLWNIPLKPLSLSFLWAAFAFAVFLSGFVNNEMTAQRDGFWLLIAVPMIFFNALPKLMHKSANILITLGLLLGVSPYILISFFLHPIWQSDSKIYSGIFPNSNQLGFTTAAMSSGVFILAIGFLFRKKSMTEILIVNLSLLICLITILVSNARTAIITFSCMSLFLIWKLFQKPKNFFIAFFIGLIIAIFAFTLNAQNPWFFERIAEVQEKDSLSGRNDIWSKTIIDMTLLGNGEKYFETNFGLGAHNTVIHVLGVNGLIACLFMVLFAIISFIYAWLYFQKNCRSDCYAIAPLVFMTCFWLLSMGEGMFGSLGNAMTIAYMLSIGVVMSDLNSQPTSLEFKLREEKQLFLDVEKMPKRRN
jgi:O-antigen ligase